MAKRKKRTQTTDEGYPVSILHKGTFCNFEMKCRITGDLVYTGQRGDGVDISVLLINPDAAEHQRRYLARGG